MPSLKIYVIKGIWYHIYRLYFKIIQVQVHPTVRIKLHLFSTKFHSRSKRFKRVLWRDEEIGQADRLSEIDFKNSTWDICATAIMETHPPLPQLFGITPLLVVNRFPVLTIKLNKLCTRPILQQIYFFARHHCH